MFVEKEQHCGAWCRPQGCLTRQCLRDYQPERCSVLKTDYNQLTVSLSSNLCLLPVSALGSFLNGYTASGMGMAMRRCEWVSTVVGGKGPRTKFVGTTSAQKI